MFENTLSFAREQDRIDPLREYREQFHLPPSQTYFLGNSLGLQPKTAAPSVHRVMQQWSEHGVEAFFKDESNWLSYHDQLTDSLSRIVGARPDEISIMNQLSVNLHLMLVSFFRPQGKRRKILCEAHAFSSDQYVLETHVRHLGLDPDEVILEVLPREGQETIHAEDVLQMIRDHGEEIALVLMGGINYYTGQFFDLREITAAAHLAGAYAGFDLAHAAGNVSLSLHDWQVDFACWCNYKYLNGGPGAVGAVFINQRFLGQDSLPRLGGWWGQETSSRFLMEKGFKPATSATGWQLSTPPLMLLAALHASLDLFDQAGMENLHAKRARLNDYLWFVLGKITGNRGQQYFKVITPEDPASRGAQVSLLVPGKGKMLHARLMEKGIIVDYREPDVVRLAPVPFYNSFEEVFHFGEVLSQL